MRQVELDRVQVVIALAMNDGFIVRAARELGQHKSSVRRFIERDGELSDLARWLRERVGYVFGSPTV
jgi:hypothetical protein